MTIQSVVRMGTPNLFEKSKPVTEFNCSSLDQLIQDMKDTMEERGGVGIAAPQIGRNLRVIMFGFEKNARYPDEKPVPFTILINPEITMVSAEVVEGWEGCLSVPGLRGKVPRHTKIRYTGFDPQGIKIEREVDGFHARAVQHECDHLDGILFPHRIVDMKNFGFEDILWERIYGQGA